MPQLIGPFKQLVSLTELPIKGALSDEQLTIIENAAVSIHQGKIEKIAPLKSFNTADFELIEIEEELVLTPGLIDAHTHMAWGGNRSRDYAMRMAGKTYQEILAAGGGIFDSVAKTQQESSEQLLQDLLTRVNRQLTDGVTTMEVKTGYGLLPEQEIRLLEIINQANLETTAELVPTCLAAHVCPSGFEKKDFLELIEKELLPVVKGKELAHRVDIFVEDNAFPVDLAKPYLLAAKNIGFDITIHADQFTTGGSELAIQIGAISADHLEASSSTEISMLAESEVVPIALPGASLGLGMQFTPARRLLDAGASLAIATDWNPGSAPMGDLLVQASLLGIYEKLSSAELLAGMTFRAANALGLPDRGRLAIGERADMIAFPVTDYRDIFYNQGKVKPSRVWVKGQEQ